MPDKLIAAFRITVVAATLLVIACSEKGQPRSESVGGADSLGSSQGATKSLSAYRQALQASPKDPEANHRLGAALLQLGDLTQAYHYLLKAQALEPTNPSIEFDLGVFYLIRSNPEFASEKAQVAFDKDSASVPGSILLSATAVTPDQIGRSIQKLQSATTRFGREALPRLALGNLYLLKADAANAERSFKAAAESEPKSPAVHSVLAAFYTARGNSRLAEQELRAFNELVAGDSLGRVQVAMVYLLLNRRDDAKRVLREEVAKAPANSPSSRLLAELAIADGDAQEAGKTWKASPNDTADVDALVLQGRYHLLLAETAAAVRTLNDALRLGPTLAPVRFAVALADLQRASTVDTKALRDSVLNDAVAQLETASNLVSNYPEAVFQLATLKTQLGAPQDGIAALDRYSQANPKSVKAKVVTGATLLGSARIPEAAEAFQDAVRSAPENAEGHYWLGAVLLRDGKAAEARREFETSINLAPGYAEPVTQLVLLDMANGRADSALARLTAQTKRAPQSAHLFDLLGIVHVSRNDQTAAEAAFLEAIRLDPRLVDAHTRLADLYRAYGRFDQAVAHASEAVRLSPRSVTALVAAGASYHEKGDAAQAKKFYARVLAIDPQNVGANNNLAVLLTEQAGGRDSAFTLATKARQLAPNDPYVADTFGWVLYRRGSYSEALAVLKVSGARLPESPAVQYHLGMAAQQLGDTAVARQALTRSLSSPSNFDGKDEARRALALLK